MAALTLYANASVFIDNNLLTQENSVTLEKKSGLNPVFTVAEGLAGMSQGAATMEISIENAVPSADFEFNPDAYMRVGQVVEVGIVMANRQTRAKGFITDASYSHSVNDSAKLSMKILCRYSDFE